MPHPLTVSLRKRGLALVTLVGWVIASHTCLLAEAGVTFDFGATSHHAPEDNADRGSQDGEDCCEELALVWLVAERVLATNTCALWNAFEAGLTDIRLLAPSAGYAPPIIWPPGGQSFFSQLVGSSLFGRAPPVIG